MLVNNPIYQNSTTCLIGIGTGACSIIERLSALNPGIARYVGINALGTNLATQEIEQKIFLPVEKITSFGCARTADIGQKATEIMFRDIYKAIEGCSIVLIVACMGGVCGSGGAHIIARIAKSQGIPVISIVTTPFQFEGLLRAHNALEGIANLQKFSDSLLVLPNERLIQLEFSNMPIELALRAIDKRIELFLHTITNLYNKSSMIPLEHETIQSIIRDRRGIWCESFFVQKISEISQYIKNSLDTTTFPSVDLSAAEICLTHICVNQDFPLEDLQICSSTIQNSLPNCEVFTSVSLNQNSSHCIGISLLLSGVGGTAMEAFSTLNGKMCTIPSTALESTGSMALLKNHLEDDILEVPAYLRK